MGHLSRAGFRPGVISRGPESVGDEALRVRAGVVVEEEEQITLRLRRAEVAGRAGAGARLGEQADREGALVLGHPTRRHVLAVEHNHDLERAACGIKVPEPGQRPLQRPGAADGGDHDRDLDPGIHARAEYTSVAVRTPNGDITALALSRLFQNHSN